MHDPEAVAACRNCETPLTDEFCSKCGEERFHEHQLSWGHFVHDAVHEFLHVDGKIAKSIWHLLLRPGFLTAEYWAGRRPRYIRPLRLFLIAAAIHLVAMSVTFYRFEFFLSQDRDGGMHGMIQRIADRTHSSKEAVIESLDHKFHKVYSIMQYAAVLGFAWAPFAIYRRRRPYYLEHLIFSLHVYAAYFVYSSVLSRLVTAAQWQRWPSMLIMLAYFLFALRLLYRESWGRTFFKAIALRAGLFLAEFVVIGVALGSAIAWVRIGGIGH